MISLKHLYLLLFVAIVSGCNKKFLDIKDNTNLYRQSYVTDLKTTQDFLRGLYFRYTEILESYSSAAYPEVIADNLQPVTLGGTFFSHYTWQQKANESDNRNGPVGSPESTNANGIWAVGYQLILGANFIIESANAYRDENKTVADDVRAQALAMRAFLHFRLVNIFAQHYKFTPDGSHPGVPYITTHNIHELYTRQTVAEVYNHLINDLTEALVLFSSESIDSRVMNKRAAKALLARLYLYKEDYDQAKTLALEVTEDAPLMTQSAGYPNAIFKKATSASSEILMQLTPVMGELGSSIFISRVFTDELLLLVGTSDITDVLHENPNDVRQFWITINNGTNYITKFPHDAATDVNPIIFPASGSYYVSLFRSAEMFLTVAEAAYFLHDENTARQYVDAIRQRADPSILPTNASGSELLLLIQKERRKELCFEGERMNDLQRWRLGVHRVDAPLEYAKDLPYPSSKAIAPIPPTEIQLMGIPQNSDY